MLLLQNEEQVVEQVEKEPDEKKQPSAKGMGEIPTLSVKLMVIIAVVVAMLAFANGLTKDAIAANEKKTSDEARFALFSEADSFDAISAELSEDDKKYITEIYEAKKDGSTVGYCISVYANGFGGKVSMIVGVSTDGLVSGVKVVDHSETAGVGERIISNGQILNQFVNVSSNSLSSVSTISGASITSKAVIEGVTRALKIADTLTDKGY